MEDALLVHRLHFGFTVSFHYLFAQLSMGLALLVFLLKTGALLKKDEGLAGASRFWVKVLGISFAIGVVTGIPMEFQFGTNWARFSREVGGVIGQTLAMETIFSFFLESTFLGLLLFGERRLGPRGHWFASLMVFVGAWLSGYFIIATNAWMQHPVGHKVVDGTAQLDSFWALLLNPWAGWQYAHNMSGAVVTASFAVAALGAYYLLAGKHAAQGRTFVRLGVAVGLAAAIFQLMPSGDHQGKLVAKHQPVTLAAMEGLFRSQEGAPVAFIGQPDMEKMRLDNPIEFPRLLSFLTYRRWEARVEGLDAFPREDWPDNVPLLYYSYHIMVGLGTIFIAVLLLAAWLLFRGRLFESRRMLWVLLLALPFPFIANTAGWMTAELGRQPWLVYGISRTRDGFSHVVSAGNGWFTLLGFMGTYTLLTFLFLFLVGHVIHHGPDESPVEALDGKGR
jgi:cytochrome d ubiquinol oxidase subunit I